MNGPSSESVELFLQEASENLQYLREYSGILQEPQTRPDDLEKLYIAAHTLAGTSASYGFPQFSEVGAKMAHIFHYAMHATLTPDMHGPLTEFISDAISVLEFDLLQISTNGEETTGDIAAFKQRYSFAFPAAPATETRSAESAEPAAGNYDAAADATPAYSYVDRLPEDGEVGEEVLEFFIPEAEEHLQAVTECLLALEASPNPEEIHRLFRSMHTIKGSAAQVGLHRLSAVAHRVEDLDRPDSRRRAASERGNRGHLPGIGRRTEKIPASPVGRRFGNARRGGSAAGANRRICSGRRGGIGARRRGGERRRCGCR